MTDPRKTDESFPPDADDPRLSALYRRSADEEPGEAIDRAILDAAHKAAGRSWRNWFGLPQLIVAATLLLGVGVALRVFDVAPLETREHERFDVLPDHRPGEEAERRVADPQRSEVTVRDFKASKPKPPPMPVAEEAGAQFDSAPHVSPQQALPAQQQMRKRSAAKASPGVRAADCTADIPDDIDNRSAWRARIEELLFEGDRARALCLRHLYRERFFELDQKQPGMSEQE